MAKVPNGERMEHRKVVALPFSPCGGSFHPVRHVVFWREERNAAIPEHRNTSRRVSVPQDTRHLQPLFVHLSNSTTVVVMPLLHLADER